MVETRWLQQPRGIYSGELSGSRSRIGSVGRRERTRMSEGITERCLMGSRRGLDQLDLAMLH